MSMVSYLNTTHEHVTFNEIGRATYNLRAKSLSIYEKVVLFSLQYEQKPAELTSGTFAPSIGCPALSRTL